jgi:hypothetical protein
MWPHFACNNCEWRRILCFKAVGESFCSLNMSWYGEREREREREREPKTTVNHSFMPRADSTNNHKIIVVKIWPNNGEHMGCTLFGWSASPGQQIWNLLGQIFFLFYMWKTTLIESNLLATMTSFRWKTLACHYPKTCLLATITSFGWKALACHYPKYAFFGHNDFFWVENIGLPLS